MVLQEHQEVVVQAEQAVVVEVQVRVEHQEVQVHQEVVVLAGLQGQVV